jgi:hypothetical protein
MSAKCRGLGGSLLFALLLAACERTPQDAGPFNQPLGGAKPVAPSPAPVIDAGILADQSSYQPARHGSVEPAAPGVSAGGEEEAIRGRIREFFQAAAARNVDAVFDAFVPEQIAAVIPLKSAVIESVEKIEALQRQLNELGGAAQAAEGQLAIVQAIGGKLLDALTGALTVEMLSADQAAVRIDAVRFEESLNTLVPEIQEALKQLAAASGDPAAAGAVQQLKAEDIAAAAHQVAGFSLPVAKVDDLWRIALPLRLTDAHAQIARDGLVLLNEYLDRVMEQLQSLETPDPEAISNILTQIGLEMTPRALGLWMKVQMLLTESAPPEGAEPAEPQAGAEEPDTEREQGEEEEEATPPRGGRTPRVP